jgi:hypothetical protein
MRPDVWSPLQRAIEHRAALFRPLKRALNTEAIAFPPSEDGGYGSYGGETPAGRQRSVSFQKLVQNARMIRFQGTLTPDLYRRALGVTGRSIQVVAWMLILAGVINLFFAHLAQPVSWAMPLFLATFGVMLLISPRITVTRAFATDRMLSEPVTGDADEQGVRLETAHGRSDLPWTLMHKVVVSPNLVTIYQSASIIRVLPREFFADEESWQAFRRLALAAPSAAKPSPRPIGVVLLWIAIIIVVFVLWMLFNRT